MVKTLSRHGNSMALVIDKPILDLLKVDVNTPLEISTDGDAIIIRPLRNEARQLRLDESLSRLNQAFAPALKKLAE